ncbi:MAG: outer membrane protein assembly factor [Proteobacteria bacterium]|nr:outer membrane protein assembly factor [Pseudomonadota bacterium]
MIEIDGLNDELEAAARANLELQQYLDRDTHPSELQRLMERGQEEIARGLEPYGYYHVQVRGELEPSDDRIVARYRVTLGEQVFVRERDVTVDGPGGQLPEVRRAIDRFQPAVGEALQHGLYEDSKALIGAALQTNGYFDAELKRHRVEVTRASRRATIDLNWQSGERYRIGDVRFDDVQFPPAFLQRYIPWEPGAPYDIDQLLTLQQRLVDADYFATVSVQPALEQRVDGAVPVNVLLVPAKRTVYTASAFVSTDAGPGARLGVERRWLNRRGHKAGGQVEYSARLEDYTAYYRIPWPGRQSRLFSFAGGYRDEQTDSSRSRLMRLSAIESIDDWRGYARTLGLQFLNGDFTIADEQRSSRLLYAEANLGRKRANDLVFPSRGLSVTYTARAAAEAVLSDTNLLQLRADAKWIQPASDRSRLIVRASLGALAAGDFDALPPELRFFAGGDRSVRGFDYQQIGERNATGGVIGGRYLAVASAEFEYYFLEKWGAAVFVDAGDAFKTDLNANIGAGIGLRWKSPVGIVRVDLGVPVETDLPDDGLRIHLMIGPDL